MNAIHSYCFFCDRCQKKVVFLLVLKTGIVLNAVAFFFSPSQRPQVKAPFRKIVACCCNCVISGAAPVVVLLHEAKLMYRVSCTLMSTSPTR